MEIGFLGLGIMGKAMSMNLLKHGFKVTVWNRTLSKCDELVEHGASVCESPAEVVKKCKYTIAISAITGKGGRFVEGPVSGSKKPAEDGQLIILAADDKSFYLGQVGNGAKMKLVVNMVMGSLMNAFSEGLVLAEKTGLSSDTLLDILGKDLG